MEPANDSLEYSSIRGSGLVSSRFTFSDFNVAHGLQIIYISRCFIFNNISGYKMFILTL